MMYVYIVKQKALGCVYIRKYIRRRRVSRYQRAERRVQSSYQRKVVVLRRLTVRLSLPLSLPSFFLSALSIRGSLQSRMVHLYAYLRVSIYIFTHSPIPESWPMVIDTECRSFAIGWNDYYDHSSLVFSLLFLPVSFPLPYFSSVISPTPFFIENVYISPCIFDSSLALLLSPSFAAVTILLPDTRGIIRTGSSLLAWRFVGEVYLLRCTRSFSLRLMYSRVSYAWPWRRKKKRKTLVPERATKRQRERSCTNAREEVRRRDKEKESFG